MDKLRLFLKLLRGLFVQGPRTLNFANDFLAAWNAHDAARVAGLVGDGSYVDLLCRKPMRGAALQQHAQALITGFPDLAFQLTGPVTVGDGGVAARYRLQGTHGGPLPGDMGIAQVDATQRRIDVLATLFIEFAADGRVQITNSLDPYELAPQLGFNVFLLPSTQGHYQFGAYYRLNKGNVQPPEAIGITWLQVRGTQHFDAAATLTNQVLEAFSDKPGFITGIIGARPPDEQGNSSGFTLSAWENLEALEANLLPNETHKHAVQQFMKTDVAWGTHSRVYQLVRAKPLMIACNACGKKNNAHKPNHVCSACGAELEAAPAYW